MFIYNVHTPSKTFALIHKDDESHQKLVNRIYTKAGVKEEDKSKTGLVYEYKGSRWSLDDDEDLHILLSRYPPSSTPSVTLHLTHPSGGDISGHSYTQSQSQSQTRGKALGKAPSQARATKSAGLNGTDQTLSQNESNDGDVLPPAYATSPAPKSTTNTTTTTATTPTPKTKTKAKSKSQAEKARAKSVLDSNTRANAQNASAGTGSDTGFVRHGLEDETLSEGTAFLAPAPKKKSEGEYHLASPVPPYTSDPPANPADRPSASSAPAQSYPASAYVAGGAADRPKSRARSVYSTVSRKSKYGDPDAEPLGDVKRREWHEFHGNNGVRTVIGKVGDVPNVRMLLKSGHRQIYLSRQFAIKHGFLPKKFGAANGGFAYAGILPLPGPITLTIGSRTSAHKAYVTEENKFDVILGRAWIEKMGVKIDPLDQTVLTYMDTGEPIACDVVVLKDEKGDIITIT
ncbi:hypothetical protein AYX13_03531 [Cryptococcus neoformans]|nr:hypothetical protein AYX13_03531 [Cryptococcus neoformans var. grubii]